MEAILARQQTVLTKLLSWVAILCELQWISFFFFLFFFLLFLFLFLRNKGQTKKRVRKEETEKGDCGTPTRKGLFLFIFEILSDLNQAVPI